MLLRSVYCVNAIDGINNKILGMLIPLFWVLLLPYFDYHYYYIQEYPPQTTILANYIAVISLVIYTTSQLQLFKNGCCWSVVVVACALQICAYIKYYQPQATHITVTWIPWWSTHSLTTSGLHVPSRCKVFAQYSCYVCCTTLLLKEMFACVTMYWICVNADCNAMTSCL